MRLRNAVHTYVLGSTYIRTDQYLVRALEIQTKTRILPFSTPLRLKYPARRHRHDTNLGTRAESIRDTKNLSSLAARITHRLHRLWLLIRDRLWHILARSILIHTHTLSSLPATNSTSIHPSCRILPSVSRPWPLSVCA